SSENNPSNTIRSQGRNQLALIGGGVGGTYNPNDDWTIFAGVYTGFSPPSPRASIEQDVGSERSIAGELGARLFETDFGVSLETTGFFTHFQNLIVIDNIGGTGTGRAENVGQVNSGGIEFAIAWDPAIQFDWPINVPVSFNYTWTHARLVGDADSADPNSLFAGGRDGNKVPYIPDHALAASIGVEGQYWGSRRAGILTSASYMSQMYATASNTDTLLTPEGIPDSRFGEIPSNWIVDLTAYFWIDPDERIKLLVGAQNINNSLAVVTRHPIGPRPARARWVYGGIEASF
ncbi:TonB-dependent receptor, partial [Myxococcota bacterium]|nr:TonB-dependent receptor [Myxococcota bacterium]